MQKPAGRGSAIARSPPCLVEEPDRAGPVRTCRSRRLPPDPRARARYRGGPAGPVAVSPPPAGRSGAAQRHQQPHGVTPSALRLRRAGRHRRARTSPPASGEAPRDSAPQPSRCPSSCARRPDVEAARADDAAAGRQSLLRSTQLQLRDGDLDRLQLDRLLPPAPAVAGVPPTFFAENGGGICW